MSEGGDNLWVSENESGSMNLSWYHFELVTVQFGVSYAESLRWNLLIRHARFVFVFFWLLTLTDICEDMGSFHPHEEDQARIVLVLKHERLLLNVSKESIGLKYTNRLSPYIQT